MTESTVTVIGGGTMGSGIAVAFLVVGDRVTLVESTEELAEGAVDRVRSSLERLARRDESLDVAALLDGFDTRTELDASEPTLIVEAIPEDLGLKQGLFAEVEDKVGEDTILASNTSSLSISAIAAGLRRPDRFVGMHFFNPVPVSSLVEIVVGAGTSASTVDQARALAEHVGKTPIVVNDSPGFASSRLGVMLGLEAIRMLESGVATAEDIDTAMELGYRHPMGPLRLTDLVGLDVRLAIADHLREELGDRFEPPELLRRMVAEGKLGKKTGQGFHAW